MENTAKRSAQRPTTTRSIEYFHTLVAAGPHADPEQPIEVKWCMGTGSRNRGNLRLFIPSRISSDPTLRPILAEIATIYYVFVVKSMSAANRDGRNLKFIATYPDVIRNILTTGGTDLPHDLQMPSRLLAVRFNDAFCDGGSAEFFDDRMNAKGKDITRVNTYDFSHPPYPLMDVYPIGTTYITFTALNKYAYRLGRFSRGAWSDLLRITSDPKNKIVFRGYSDGADDIIENVDIFSPQTGTLLHCLQARDGNFRLIDVRNLAFELRNQSTIRIERNYGTYNVTSNTFLAKS